MTSKVESYRAALERLTKKVIDHNIMDDKVREKLWKEITSHIDYLEKSLANMPIQLRASSIINYYIKEFNDLADEVL